MNLPSFSTINLTLNEGIGHLMLNQPPSNQMTLDFFREFREAVAFIEDHNVFKAVVISGNGRHFSSGANLPDLMELIRQGYNGSNDTSTPIPEPLVANYTALLRLEQLPIPVVSAIRGVCLGSAFELALFSHVRISGTDTVFSMPEASFNLLPGLGGIRKLTDLTGVGRAMELVLKAASFTATDALEWNLVHKVVPKREVLSTSINFTRNLLTDYRREKVPLYVKKFFS